MNAFAAHMMATLHVFNVRMAEKDRSERGQTTAEYVGILVFVAVLVLAVIAFKGEFADQIKGIVTAVFDKIKSGLG